MRSSNQCMYDIICGNQGDSLESLNSTAISWRWISQIRAAWSRTPSSIPSPISCYASNLTINFSTIIVGRASCPSLYSI
jgi:hypothetical protein